MGNFFSAFKRIKFKISLSFGTLSLIILFALGTFIYLYTKKNTEYMIKGEQQKVTDLVQKMVETSVNTTIKNYLRGITETSINNIEHYYNLYKKGKIKLDEAQKKSKELIVKKIIGKTGYIYILDSQGHYVLSKKGLRDGEKILNAKDAKGRFFVKSIVKKASKLQSIYDTNIEYYRWQNAGEKKPRLKVAVIGYFKKWDWIIGASSYVSEFKFLININDFRKAIDDITIGKTGDAFIFNGDGDTIIHKGSFSGKNLLNIKSKKKQYIFKKIIKNKDTDNWLTFSLKDKNNNYRERKIRYKYIEKMDWFVVANAYTDEIYKPLNILRNIIIIVLIITFFVTNFFASILVSRLLKPLNSMKKVVDNVAEGDLTQNIQIKSNDEIGEMSDAMNHLVSGLKKTTQFARDVGQSKFDSPYKPLSENDELGHALLVMRDELQETERNLEQKVQERTEEVVKQKELVESKNKEIIDSITYAKRIQRAILPSSGMVKRKLANAFIYFKPKDIVAGDFYWLEEKHGKILLAAADCTGHGVPGAMVSLVCNNTLSRTVREFNLVDPPLILNKVRDIVIESFTNSREEVKDGMDIALISLDIETNLLRFSGANNNLYIVSGDSITMLKGDRQPIGKYVLSNDFSVQEVQLKPGDTFYMLTDGYIDQFGGPKEKKFKSNQFISTLLAIQDLNMREQKRTIEKAFDDWKGDLEQVDDVCVIGVRI